MLLCFCVCVNQKEPSLSLSLSWPRCQLLTLMPGYPFLYCALCVRTDTSATTENKNEVVDPTKEHQVLDGKQLK